MKAPQQNKLAMYLTVIKVCTDSPSAWGGLPAFGTNFAAFSGLADTISNLAAAQATTKGGVTEQKATAKTTLIDATMVMAGALKAYAVTAGNLELEGKVRFPRSELQNLRDAEIDDRASVVCDLATAHLAALPSYGIVQATVDGFTSKIEAYEALVEAPRSATVKVKSITEAIVATFERADRVLKGVLDPLALQFLATAPAFYADYENARAIVDRPGGFAEKPEPVAAAAA